MRPTSASSFLLLASLAVGLLAGPAVASVEAQSPSSSQGRRGEGRIHGAVEDSTGAPLPQVHVGIVGSSMETTTDARGAFRFAGVRAGIHFVRVRRLGYDPLIFRVDLEDGDTVSLGVQLNPSVTSLATVNVRENATAPRLHSVGFDERRRFSGAPAAQFLTRTEIERRNPTELSQLLARMGRRASECRNPIIYVDGMVMSPPAPDDPHGDLRALKNDSLLKLGAAPPRGTQLAQIPPSWIEGMEVYAGPSEIPSAYNPSGRGATCVILLWLR